jgi:outer membrane lipoprotein-sorting protein
MLGNFLPTSTGATETAKAIIDKVVAHPAEQAETVSVSMDVLNGDNTEREPRRTLTIQGIYRDDQNSKALITFESPHGIKGTKILTVKSDDETGQWIYLPALKKATRINSDQDVEGVLDSDLSYSDIKGESTEEYQYQLNAAKMEEYAGSICHEPAFSISALPKKKGSSTYSKRLLSISKSKYAICAVALYDNSGKLVKSVENLEFKNVSGSWRPGRSLISTLTAPTKASSKTILKYSDWKVGVKLNSKIFSVNSLAQ